mmetsp:Transcript_12367/g.34421  ORF Transcript_12367/g.34421 Transcript_12367/m.34421 type:complete len:221 (-) Transcript_12367:112-774(-)
MLSSEEIPTQLLVLEALSLLSMRSSTSSVISRIALALLLILAPASSPVAGSWCEKCTSSLSLGPNLPILTGLMQCLSPLRRKNSRMMRALWHFLHLLSLSSSLLYSTLKISLKTSGPYAVALASSFNCVPVGPHASCEVASLVLDAQGSSSNALFFRPLYTFFTLLIRPQQTQTRGLMPNAEKGVWSMEKVWTTLGLNHRASKQAGDGMRPRAAEGPRVK